jgi:quinol monooxygenase YgiN
MAHPLVQEMIKWMSSGKILAGTPELYLLEYLNDLTFTKPDVTVLDDPYICFAHIVYRPNKRQEAIPYWEKVVAETKNESGTLVYGLVVDKEKPEELFTIETYESKEYLWDVHVARNSAIQKSIQETKSMRTSLEHNLLKKVGGYLAK